MAVRQVSSAVKLWRGSAAERIASNSPLGHNPPTTLYFLQNSRSLHRAVEEHFPSRANLSKFEEPAAVIRIQSFHAHGWLDDSDVPAIRQMFPHAGIVTFADSGH